MKFHAMIIVVGTVIGVLSATTVVGQSRLRAVSAGDAQCLMPSEVNALLRESGLGGVSVRVYGMDGSTTGPESCSCSDDYIGSHCKMCGTCKGSANKCSCTCFGGVVKSPGSGGSTEAKSCTSSSQCPKGEKCRDGKCEGPIILSPCDDPLCNIE